jgi:hypothetical protein
MTDMTTTKATAAPVQATPPKARAIETAPTGKSAVVTLEELAKEMKLSPRDARMLLRLAAKQTKQYPSLGKDHVARQPWQWTVGSKALEEARKALKASDVQA